jgi:hypothetical protein
MRGGDSRLTCPVMIDRLVGENLHKHCESSLILVVGMTCTCQQCQTERVYNVPLSLHITSTFYITPLIDMSSAEFTEGYKQGIHWQFYDWRVHEQIQGHEPLSVSLLVNKLQAFVKLDYFDGHDDHRLLKEIGYLLGMYHGSVLSPYTGELRSDLTLLATFEDVDSMRGYNIGREWYFLDAEPHELRRTEANLIEYLRELASESVQFHDDEQRWHHAIGCLLGELSSQLFPATPQELHKWETQRQRYLEDYCRHTNQSV